MGKWDYTEYDVDLRSDEGCAFVTRSIQLDGENLSSLSKLEPALASMLKDLSHTEVNVVGFSVGKADVQSEPVWDFELDIFGSRVPTQDEALALQKALDDEEQDFLDTATHDLAMLRMIKARNPDLFEKVTNGEQ